MPRRVIPDFAVMDVPSLPSAGNNDGCLRSQGGYLWWSEAGEWKNLSLWSAIPIADKQNSGFITGTSVNIRLHNSSGFGTGGSIQINATPTYTYRIDDVQNFGITSSGNTIIGNDTNTTYLRPFRDNAVSCGGPSNKWSVVYAGTTSINPSDARLKTPVRAFTAAENAAAIELGAEIGIYQWLAMIEQKGEEAARLHIGMTVQRAIQIMESHGLDPMRYAFICFDEWDDEWEEDEVIVTELRTITRQTIEIVAGQAVLVEQQEEVHEPIIDSYPLFNAAGDPVLDGNGNQVIHTVTRIEKVSRLVRAAGNTYSFRMTELLAFIAAGERAARLRKESEFEAIISALEAV